MCYSFIFCFLLVSFLFSKCPLIRHSLFQFHIAFCAFRVLSSASFRLFCHCFPHFPLVSRLYTTFPAVVLVFAFRCLSGHLSRPLLLVLSFYHFRFRPHLHLFSLLSPFLPLSSDHIKTINYLRSAFLVEKRKSVFNYTEIALSRAD